MLEVAFLASHILRKMTPEDAEELYDMVTVNPARIIGADSDTISEGNRANLVVLSEKTVTEALAEHETPRLVVNNGAIVARSGQVES